MICIFLLNVGRSGSRSTATAYGLHHEPDGEEPNTKAALARAEGKIVYGETSHWWKAHLPALTRAFPNGHFIHLVRNGRNVVRSYLARDWYKPEFPKQCPVLPPHKPDMSRMEKLCWYWRYWNEQIGNVAYKRVRLETLRDIPHAHSTPKEQLPQWTDRHEAVFHQICGKLNQEYGYA